MGPMLHAHILIGQLSELLWAIANVSFDQAKASICLCYNTAYRMSGFQYKFSVILTLRY